jgi:hypothetical protein
VFRICIEGSVPGFSYRLSDRLVKDQLWDVASKSKNWADVEFVVKGKTFPAHKAILAARSPVFAAEFTKEQQGNDQPVQIQINGVGPSTVEQFLHFIYTGESMGTFANEELLKLSDEYRLTTLSRLCKVALEKIKPMQMVKLATNLNKEDEILSSKIWYTKCSLFPFTFELGLKLALYILIILLIYRPDKETEIFFDRTTPTFRCAFSFNLSWPLVSVMQYQNEDIFFAHFTGQRELNGNGTVLVHKPVIHLLCPNLCSFGLKVEDVYFSTPKPKDSWCKMELKNLTKNIELQRFIKQPSTTLPFIELNSVVYFDIKIISTIDNYYYEMMDDDWMNDFRTVSKKEKFTDVEIFVGTVKVMEAHRVILSARSPVMNAAFNKTSSTGKSAVNFGVEYDVDTVKHFLNFLYTGSLKASFKSASHKQHLLKLATFYQVETLKNFCQLFDRAPDVEELTNSLLGL